MRGVDDTCTSRCADSGGGTKALKGTHRCRAGSQAPCWGALQHAWPTTKLSAVPNTGHHGTARCTLPHRDIGVLHVSSPPPASGWIWSPAGWRNSRRSPPGAPPPCPRACQGAQTPARQVTRARRFGISLADPAGDGSSSTQRVPACLPACAEGSADSPPPCRPAAPQTPPAVG